MIDNNIRKENITISSFDVGASGHLEPWALMRYFQESAARHATSLGVGFEQLKNNNIYWALTHLQLETIRWPNMAESITIETWPRNITKLYTTRDFLVKDANNNIISRSTSAWVMVDIAKRRPVRPLDKLKDISFSPDRKALGEFPEKISNEQVSQIFETSRTVGYSDLDINQHVNNTRYIEWLMDSINPNNHQHLKQLNVHFGGEFKRNNSAIIRVSRYTNDNSTFCGKIEHPKGDKKGVEVFLKFQ